MYSRQLYCTVGSFIAQQKSQSCGRNWRKVPFAAETREKFNFAAETGEKFLLQQNRGQAPRFARYKRAPGRRGIVCV